MSRHEAKHRHPQTEPAAAAQGAPAPPAAEPSPASAAAPSLAAELAAAQQEAAAAKDRALRAQAELENYRKRADRQIEEERRYANLPLVRDLLPALDDLHRAIEAAEKSANGTGLLDGVRIVAEKLEAALKKHHCVRIEALGGPFDPHCHDAIAQQPSAEHPAQTVMAVAQHGFMLHDRVVRPSQVIVSGGPAAEPPAAAGG